MENRFIIGRFEEPNRTPDSLENFTPGAGGLTITETATTLEGDRVESGVFGTYVEVEREEVNVVGDDAEWLEEVYTETVGCNFLFDPDTGVVCGDSSAIEYLFEELTAAGTPIARVELDLDAWDRDLEGSDDGYVWMRGWREGDDDDPEDVGVEYHRVSQTSRGDESNQLGWKYTRGSMYWRGYAAASGYVAIYSPSERPIDDLAAWLREDVLQYCTFAEEHQAVLAEEQTCEACGRVPDRGLEQVGDENLCAVCVSKRDEKGEVGA